MAFYSGDKKLSNEKSKPIVYTPPKVRKKRVVKDKVTSVVNQNDKNNGDIRPNKTVTLKPHSYYWADYFGTKEIILTNHNASGAYIHGDEHCRLMDKFTLIREIDPC